MATLDALEALLDEAASANPSYLSLTEKAIALERLSRSRERVQGVLLNVLATADDVAAEYGARSPADWLAHRTRSDRGPAAHQGRLADAIDRRWTCVGTALVDGDITAAQAGAIVQALEALPSLVAPEIKRKAEDHLITQAAHYPPRQLRILGRKVLEVVAPDAFDDEERRMLEAEETRARRRTFLTMRANGDGTTELRARIPDLAATRLQTYLDAYTNPRREDGTPAVTGPSDRRPYPTRLGDAFCTLLEAMPSAALPRHGGSATTVVVTIGLEHLQQLTGAGELTTGARLSVGEVRRLACNAKLIPAVLGGRSVPLDFGRTRRLFNGSQHIALAIRDKRCRGEGCTIPAAWTEAHHFGTPWASGGHTNLKDGRLLCSHHHHLAHDPRYEHTLLPNGDVRFHRRR